MATTKYYPLRLGYNDFLGRYVPRDDISSAKKSERSQVAPEKKVSSDNVSQVELKQMIINW